MEKSRETNTTSVETASKSSPLKNNRIYKLLIWENKLYSLIAFKAMMIFFFFHVMRGHSLINLIIKSLLVMLIYQIVTRILKK
jgi:hypothetical protein